MKTVALVTQKGGVGKSTLASSLAVAAQEAGEKVVVLDLDKQGTLFEWGEDRKADTPVVDQLLDDRVPQLSAILAQLKKKAGMTLAVLDCPGRADTVNNLAMKAADLCLLPSRPTKPDIRASKATVRALVGLNRPFAFVLTQCPPGLNNWRSCEAAGGLHLIGALAEPFIGARADFQDAIASGQGVTEYAPAGKAAEETRQLWAWVKKRLSEEESSNGKTAVDHRPIRRSRAV
jgi:chromosome partitioning protein